MILQLLPRSSTGERMNPYTSLWTGVTDGDGPQAFHLVLLDNGRTTVLADAVGRQALRCIRCSRLPQRLPGLLARRRPRLRVDLPGADRRDPRPQLHELKEGNSLPLASSLCGACADVCPVKIDIPRVLIHLRGRIISERIDGRAERIAMAGLARVFTSRRRYESAQRAMRLGRGPMRHAGSLPGPLSAWTTTRDLPQPPDQTFREWWRERR